ncbi:hypothetical protein F2Q68_00011210 [Brassica cretica]|uniref:Uncharacterized protein n=1 Tax=Brassica cretica TaxID=69181 RepID=A0A8S9KUQ5_BRACR|nr:hypothetical protein F2Q68_00011210 [Brassica cretica]
MNNSCEGSTYRPRWSAITLGRMLTDDPVSHKACGNSIPFTVHGIANCPGSLFFFNIILILIFSLASQNILLMSSSSSLVSLKNIHNLVLPVGTLSSSIGFSPSSEGVLTISGGFSEGNRCSSIDRRWRWLIDGGFCLSIDGGVIASSDSVGVIGRCSGDPVDRFGLSGVDRCLKSGHQTQGLQPPEHLSSYLLHYADDPPSHAGHHYYLVQVPNSQPCLATQYRSMSGMEYRSMSDGRCRSMEDECLRLMVVGEYRSTGLVSGSTVVERNRTTNRCCCRSVRSTLLCGLNAPNLQDLVRIVVRFPCCF